jgi:hypothetical protein
LITKRKQNKSIFPTGITCGEFIWIINIICIPLLKLKRMTREDILELNRLSIKSTVYPPSDRPSSVELWYQSLGITLSPKRERKVPLEFETLKWDNERIKENVFSKLLNKIK